MLIIGVDYHPSFQQIAFVNTETGELEEYRLQHRGSGKVLSRSGNRWWKGACWGWKPVARRGGSSDLAELNFELWIGDASEIRAKRVRKKKTDREDARHILGLLLENRFPRIWVPSGDNRDVRQLLWHRHRMVQMRTRIMNQLQAVALN